MEAYQNVPLKVGTRIYWNNYNESGIVENFKLSQQYKALDFDEVCISYCAVVRKDNGDLVDVDWYSNISAYESDEGESIEDSIKDDRWMIKIKAKYSDGVYEIWNAANQNIIVDHCIYKFHQDIRGKENYLPLLYDFQYRKTGLSKTMYESEIIKANRLV